MVASSSQCYLVTRILDSIELLCRNLFEQATKYYGQVQDFQAHSPRAKSPPLCRLHGSPEPSFVLTRCLPCEAPNTLADQGNNQKHLANANAISVWGGGDDEFRESSPPS